MHSLEFISVGQLSGKTQYAHLVIDFLYILYVIRHPPFTASNAGILSIRALPAWFSRYQGTAVPHRALRWLSLPTFRSSSRRSHVRPAWQGVSCLLYTSDAADDLLCVDLGG